MLSCNGELGSIIILPTMAACRSFYNQCRSTKMGDKSLMFTDTLNIDQSKQVVHWILSHCQQLCTGLLSDNDTH